MTALDDRVLCPDGACIGVIGADNRCGECGAEQIEQAAPARDGAAHAAEQVPQEVTPDWVDPDDGTPPDLENRVLCADGNCIGAVGEDGVCRECHLTAQQIAEREIAEREAEQVRAAEAAAQATQKQQDEQNQQQQPSEINAQTGAP